MTNIPEDEEKRLFEDWRDGLLNSVSPENPKIQIAGNSSVIAAFPEEPKKILGGMSGFSLFDVSIYVRGEFKR